MSIKQTCAIGLVYHENIVRSFFIMVNRTAQFEIRDVRFRFAARQASADVTPLERHFAVPTF
jgi:hypothetical protein